MKKKKNLCVTIVIKIGNVIERSDHTVEIVTVMIGAMTKTENVSTSRPTIQSQMMALSVGKSFLPSFL